MADVHIRTFQPDDAPAVAALWQRVFHDHSRWRAPDAVFARRRRRQGELFLVATRDGAVIGTTLAGYDGHRGWLYRVAVAPEQERHGVGRVLVQEAELRLRQLGCGKINLQIEGENGGVVAFYEHLGYAVEDRVSMGKPLPERTAGPGGSIEIGVYLPQVGFSWDEVHDRVRLCDREGIHSVWFMDHLYPPGMPKVPAYEAWTTATALAARTERIRPGHLVVANGFRHPALWAHIASQHDRDGAGRAHGAHPPRASRPRERLPTPRTAGEDGHHARPRERGAPRSRDRERIVSARVRPVRVRVPARARARRAARRGAPGA